MESYNPHQYEDLVNREQDPYAHTKYQIILSEVRSVKPLRILNAGCGSGDLSLLLAEAGHTVEGIDPVPEYIELAKKRATASQLKGSCVFSVSSLEDFSPEEQYDCVLATDVIEHIENDKYAVEKLMSFVRPGGMLVITVPALQSLFGYHDEILGHFRRYTYASLKKVINEEKPISVKIRYFGFTLIPICWLYSKKLRREYPIGSKNNTLSFIRKSILGILLAFDRLIPVPLGTSLLCFARKKLN